MCFFSKVTTYEKKTGVLLIETFKTLVNHKIMATRGSILGGHLLFVRSVGIWHFCQFKDLISCLPTVLTSNPPETLASKPYDIMTSCLTPENAVR